MSAAVLAELPDQLRAGQAVFERTGGMNIYSGAGRVDLPGDRSAWPRMPVSTWP